MKKYLYTISTIFTIMIFITMNIQGSEVLQEPLNYNHDLILKILF